MSKQKKLDKKKINIVQQAFDKAVKKHNLIENGDKILIGLSGGIDSLVLLDLLAIRKKYFSVDFELTAVHVDIENIPYTVDTDYLATFCQERNVKFIDFHKKIEIDSSKITTNPCFICSWNRRKILFNYTKENGYNKLALGHHKDDAIETFMINLIYHGSISSLPVKLSMFNGRMQLIRPLMYLNKQQILDYANIRGYEAKLKTCNFDPLTNRRKVWQIIESMKEFNPKADEMIFKAMSNIFEEYLPE